MPSLFTQFSGLVGLLVFLHQMWDYAPVERAVVTAAASGMAVYVVLLLGHAAIRQIVAYRPPSLAEETAGGTPEGTPGGTPGGTPDGADAQKPSAARTPARPPASGTS